MSAAVLLILSAFLASAVEAVEALTIVIAIGVTRGWRASLLGAGSAVGVLAALIAALGPAITRIPLEPLRLIVGGLLLTLGLQWLRKAILRASGHKAHRDETAAFARHTQAARHADRRGERLDRYAFAVSFKGVLLEGLEVAFIVLSFGADQHHVGLAALGAGAAVLTVATAGVAARRPLARIPENTIKLAVGVMLTSFGTFWGAEGAGAHWPGDDAALLAVLAFTLPSALGLIAHLRDPPPQPAVADSRP